MIRSLLPLFDLTKLNAGIGGSGPEHFPEEVIAHKV